MGAGKDLIGGKNTPGGLRMGNARSTAGRKNNLNSDVVVPGIAVASVAAEVPANDQGLDFVGQSVGGKICPTRANTGYRCDAGVGQVGADGVEVLGSDIVLDAGKMSPTRPLDGFRFQHGVGPDGHAASQSCV